MIRRQSQTSSSTPLNYRGGTTSPLGALVAVPSVQQDSNGGLSINGGFPAMIDFTLDGVSKVNVRNNGVNQNMYDFDGVGAPQQSSRNCWSNSSPRWSMS